MHTLVKTSVGVYSHHLPFPSKILKLPLPFYSNIQSNALSIRNTLLWISCWIVDKNSKILQTQKNILWQADRWELLLLWSNERLIRRFRLSFSLPLSIAFMRFIVRYSGHLHCLNYVQLSKNIAVYKFRLSGRKSFADSYLLQYDNIV